MPDVIAPQSGGAVRTAGHVGPAQLGDDVVINTAGVVPTSSSELSVYANGRAYAFNVVNNAGASIAGITSAGVLAVSGNIASTGGAVSSAGNMQSATGYIWAQTSSLVAGAPQADGNGARLVLGPTNVPPTAGGTTSGAVIYVDGAGHLQVRTVNGLTQLAA